MRLSLEAVPGTIRRWRGFSDRAAMLALGGMHLAASLIYRLSVPWFKASNWPWDSTWQALPMDTLHANLPQSLWYLHMQPPLFNLMGAIFGWAFPTHYLDAMYAVQVLLVTLMAGLTYPIARAMIGSRPVAWLVAAVFVALNPSFLVWEPVVFYTLPVACLLTLCAYGLVRFQATHRIIWLYVVLLGLNLTILMRSLYHLVLLLPLLALVAVLAGRAWRRVVLVGLAISLLSVAWYAKNYVEFGFFGSSSWSGDNLWHAASARYSQAHLAQLAGQGVIDPLMAEVRVFTSPSAYTEYGYTRTSQIAALAHDDLNNINVIAISRTYGSNALRLIRHDPWHYLDNVVRAYSIFMWPTYYREITLVPRPLAWHMRVYRALSYAPWAVQWIDPSHRLPFFSAVFLVLPLALLGYGLFLVARGRASRRAWTRLVRAEAVTLFSAGLIAYTAIVGSLFEFGENHRFKVMIEPLLWVFLASMLYRAARYLRQRGRPRPSTGEAAQD